MAGKATPHKYNLVGKGHKQHMSPAIKAGLYYWGKFHTSHFAVPKRDSCMAGYHCLMPTAFIPSCGTSPSLMPAAFFPVANNVKNPDRNLSGKSDEREVKLCKTCFFTLHFYSSFCKS